MAEGGVQHVEPRARGWALRRGGAEQAGRLFASKQAAEERARRILETEGGEVVVHDREGNVQARWRRS